MKKVFGVLLIMVLLGLGCASQGNKQIAQDEIVNQIEPGVSTKEDVKRLVGEPTMVDFSDSGQEKWVYQYVRAKTRATSFIPVAGMLVGGADTKTHSLTIIFNDDGTVQKMGRGESTGGAGGIQD